MSTSKSASMLGVGGPGLLLLACMIVGACGAPEPAAAPEPTSIPVVAQAASSGDGKIAFVSDRDGNFEIYVMNADGTNQTRVTNNAAEDVEPDWSPDGSKIAFFSDRDGNHEIYVMDADGSNQTRLTSNADLDEGPAWSPDGTRIAYHSRIGEGNWEIYVMNADGSNKTRLTFNLTQDRAPAWSPDGARIAYVSGHKEISVMNADGSGQVSIADGLGDGAPAWSPDGKIAFHSERADGDNMDLYVMNSDGTNPTRLTNSPGGEGAPAWSPDGSKIAFFSLTEEGLGISVMDADGTNVASLTGSLDTDLFSGPSWAAGSVSGVLVAGSTSSSAVPAAAPVAAGGSLQLVGTALTEKAESPLAGVYVHGNYAFVGSQSVAYGQPNIKTGIRILDISNPANPTPVGRIPLRSFEYGKDSDHSHGDAVATRIDSPTFQGDIAIVLQGVPDTFSVAEYPMPFGIWDVTSPADPQFLGPLSLGNHFHADDLGDKPNDTKAVHGQYFYTVYSTGENERHEKDHHLAVVDLSDPRNPLTVGRWEDTKQVHMRGLSVNAAGTRVYIIGQFGREFLIYVLDVQDPAKPVELARFVWPFPFAGGFSPGRPVPNADDSLLLFADGSWEGGRESRIHILDISDLSAIREISTVDFPEHGGHSLRRWKNRWSWAHDLAIRGNLVYSTWLEGGVQLIDISDPANPVKLGGFFSPNKGILNKIFEKTALSDIALFGDYAVATTVWGPGPLHNSVMPGTEADGRTLREDEMNGKRWGQIAVLLTVLVFALTASPVFGAPKPDRGKVKGDGLDGGLVVTACMVSGADCVSSGPVEVHIHVTVIHAVVGSVKGANVVLSITDVSDGSVFALKRKTDSNGVAHFEKNANGGSDDQSTTFNIDATAVKDKAEGHCTPSPCLVVVVDEGSVTLVP